MIFGVEEIVGVVAVHGGGGVESGGSDAGNLAELVDELVLELEDGFVFFDERVGNVESEGLELLRVGEAGIDVSEGAEGTNHEAGTDEKDQGYNDLIDDEDAASSVLFARLREGAAACADGGAEANAGVFENGNAGDEEAAKQSDGESEEENGAVDADLIDARKSGRGDGHEDAERGESEAEANEAAEKSEGDAFHENFAGDARARSAEGGADGEFLATAFDSDEKQVGDVGTGDEQNHSDGTHENPECVADVTDDVFLQRAEIGADVGVFENFGIETIGGGEAAGNDGKHASDVGAGLLHGDAGL